MLGLSIRHATRTVFWTSLVAVLIAVALMWMVGRSEATNGPPSPRGPSRGWYTYRWVVAVDLVNCVIWTATTTVIIPESYGLARELGQGAVFSGFLISTGYAMSILGAVTSRQLLDPWSQPRNRSVTLALTFGMVASSLLYAFAANPPVSWAARGQVRSCLLFAARLLMGVLAATGPILRIMVQRVMPKSELVQYGMWRSGLLSLGIGLGPVISSLGCWSFDAEGVRARSAVPVLLLAAVQLLFLVAVWAVVPADLERWESEKRAMDGEDGRAGSGTLAANSEADAPVDESAVVCATRRKIWQIAIFLGIERAMIVSALEAATAFILEKEFLVPTRDIGIFVGGTFLVGMPLLAGALAAKTFKWLADTTILCVATVLSAGLTPLLSRSFVGAVAGGGTSVCSLLFADVLIFPMCYLANGVADGFAYQYAIPKSAFSVENFVIVSSITQNSVGRLFGPPAARALLEYMGRDCYATFQLVLTVSTTLSAWSLTRAATSLTRAATSLKK